MERIHEFSSGMGSIFPDRARAAGRVSSQPLPVASGAAGWPRQVMSGVSHWLERRRTIHELAGLDDRMLRDIGLARGEVRAVVDGMMSVDELVTEWSLRRAG